MTNSLGYYRLVGAHGWVVFNIANVISTQMVAAGLTTVATGDRTGIVYDLNAGKCMFYDIPVATGIATPTDATDYDIPGWSAGQPFAVAAGANNVTVNLRIDATDATITAAGAAFALARGATVG